MAKHIVLQAPAPKPVTLMDVQGYYAGDALENLRERAAGTTTEVKHAVSPVAERVFIGLPLRISKIIGGK